MIDIKNIENYNDKTVILQGFVDKIRNLQYVMFIILRNSTGKIQITIEKENNVELATKLENLTNESTIKVIGKVFKNENVKMGGIEIIPEDVIITSLSSSELPFNIKDMDKSLRETRLDYRFLDLRREENYILFKTLAFMESKMREYWINNEYNEIHTPKISSNAAESGAEMFKLDYFGTPAVLSQSPQFYKQMMMAAGFNRVFEIGPVFRAENSHTSYHASEIWMADAEIGWIENYNDVMDELENWVKYFMSNIKDEYGELIKEKFNVLVSDTSSKFPRIPFDECKKILKEKYNFVSDVLEDLERHEEELLCKYAKEKFNSDFIFVTNFPYSARSFYVMKDEQGVTQSFDLLFKGVEISSGAQREHRPEILEKQIIEKGLDPKLLDFYIDFFKYGCPPHGGFGIGINRILMKIFEIDNIREATLIYRGPTRINP